MPDVSGPLLLAKHAHDRLVRRDGKESEKDVRQSGHDAMHDARRRNAEWTGELRTAPHDVEQHDGTKQASEFGQLGPRNRSNAVTAIAITITIIVMRTAEVCLEHAQRTRVANGTTRDMIVPQSDRES